MELKPYQKKVLTDLEQYLEYVQAYKRIDQAFNEFWKDRVGAYNPLSGEGMEPYKNNVPGAPNVCIKVPTAGGKTFIAANALKVIFDAFNYDKTKAVVWLVPSVTILDQTIKNLSDISHPYRQRINTHFGGKVEVYTKDALLQGAGFSPASVNEQLSILILSFDSLRSRKKEDRKIYQENGQLASFAESGDTWHLLENTDDTALINVIRKLNPVVIVDESHNAESELSVEMLKNLNPCFILDLTATPRNNSNIISYVNAFELKRENMVKLPVIVYNHHDKTEVVNSALQLQRRLELLAQKEEKNGGRYIRPMVLFQAQPRTGEDNTTFEKLKQKLVELQIPEEQIKIKTADINELKNIDLHDRNCPVRYIITVNALKEGWDCPFAYILASLADRSSNVDVEQILGRVLRQPYVIKHSEAMLNLSYVLTASVKFMDTLQNIVQGLNRAGFSSKDYKVADSQLTDIKKTAESPAEQLTLQYDEEQKVDSSIDEIDTERITAASESEKGEADSAVSEIEKTAVQQDREYERAVMKTNDSSIANQYGDKIKTAVAKEHFIDVIKDVKIPQFFLEVGDMGIFGTETSVPLSRESLLKDFPLSKGNTEINFDEVSTDLYKVDLEKRSEADYTPAFMKLDKSISPQILKFILSAPKERQVKEIAVRIVEMIGNMWPVSDDELFKYVKRVVEDLSPEQIVDLMNREYTYKDRIKDKIQLLTSEYAEKTFNKFIDTDKIKIKESYKIPEAQYPGDTEDYGIAKSLYGKEFRMNEFEKRAINDVANLDNIMLWTKNPDKKGLRINGFINHYPDFIVITKSGKVLVIETKGDDRDNTDTMQKIKLGKTWANKAGEKYKYFMIFDKKSMEGAYTLSDALKIIAEL